MILPSRLSGVISGLVSSATFGLIPLFTLPLLASDIPVETILTYRFGIAALCMGLILKLLNLPMLIPRSAFFKLGALSFFYLMAVLLYFYALSFLPSGVVATLQFLFPVMVMLIMILFFHEKFRWATAIAVALAVGGVGLLSLGESIDPQESSGYVIIGIALSLLSGFGNALYFVGIQIAKLPKIHELVMTFHVMLFGTAACLLNSLLCGSLVWINNLREFGLAVLLALVTAVIANITLILAIRSVGSTLTSILGVLEPLTAVAVGTFVFGEPFTRQLGIGIVLIASSVFLALKNPAQ